MDGVNLVGAEAVSRAGGNMFAAATTMSQAANLMDTALASHMNFMSNWLERFEAAVQRISKENNNGT